MNFAFMSAATLYADPAKGMRVWQSKNFLHGSLSASEKHEKVREVLLDLFPLDNRCSAEHRCLLCEAAQGSS